MRTPAWCRRRAGELGPARRRADRPACWRPTPCTGCVPPKASSGSPNATASSRLDAACRRAIDVGDPTYRTVKGILAAGTETDDRPAAAAPTAPAHLHGPLRLFNPDEAAG